MRSRPLVGQAHGVVLFPHLQHGNRNLNECIIWPCQLPIMFFAATVGLVNGSPWQMLL